MKKFRLSALAAIVAVALALGLQIPTFAQTALYSTTLGAQFNAPTQGSPNTLITLASGTSVAVGQGMVIDGEYVTVQSAGVTSTQWNVSRGQSGTDASTHASGSAVLFGSPQNFYFTGRQPSGLCVSTQQQALPRVVVGSPANGGVSIYDCPAVNTLASSTAASWARITSNGGPYYNGARFTGWTYVTTGALTIQPGIQSIGSSGALAMTLAAPSKYQDGMVMLLQATTAQAHTVTYTAGFFQNTTSSDVATFGGAIGDEMIIFASAGTWRVLSLRNVTLG